MELGHYSRRPFSLYLSYECNSIGIEGHNYQSLGITPKFQCVPKWTLIHVIFTYHLNILSYSYVQHFYQFLSFCCQSKLLLVPPNMVLLFAQKLYLTFQGYSQYQRIKIYYKSSKLHTPKRQVFYIIQGYGPLHPIK